MVVHAIAKACQAELSLHSFLSNIVETSMISFFIAIAQAAIPECFKTIDHAEIGLELMRATILVPGPGMWFTKGAWEEYIEVMALVLEAQRKLLEGMDKSFATCNNYWASWRT